MNLLFANINNDRVGDTEFVQHYSGVNNSMATAKLRPSIEDAVELNILKLLSQDYYEALYTRFNTDTLSTEESAKIHLLQKAIANYAIAKKITEGASLSELGLHFMSDDGNTSTAPQWKEESSKYELTKKADEYFERFLSYVYENTASFDGFSVEIEVFFIRSAKELSKYIAISNSLMTFFNLQSSIRKLSEQQLKPLLTATLYDNLLEAVRTDTLTSIQSNLLKKVNAWLSAAALLHALPFLNVDLSNGKLFTVSTNDGYRNRQAARDSQINLLMSQLRIDIEDAKSDLVLFTNENLTELGLNDDVIERERIVTGTNSVGLF